ncbi:MAG TPA: hypothetical protein VFO79_00645 [Xanthomonadales bacterium]|nr:hypothetical protein [Xanthomonadales bacterium]
MTRSIPLLCALAATFASGASAADPASLRDALAATRPALDLRYRHESVDDDAFARDAEAHTLRARLGAKTGSWEGWSAYAEIEHVEALFGERYDSTANGRPAYPVVADPEATELNQAWLAWAPRAGTSMTLGRQRVVLDNMRHFGNVGFRQNEQTFDAFQLQHAVGAATTLRYAYLEEVHRVFGDDHPNPIAAEQDLDAHLLHATRTVGGGALVGYGYFVENQDLPATSARTLGLRWTGTHAFERGFALVHALEYARQDDYADGAAVIDADYALGEIGIGRAGHVLKAGIEVLGGDGDYGFQTPFATLHAFNGWADRFLTTPRDGLVDRYLVASGKLGAFDYAVAAHDYEADHGSADYGSEWGASLRRAFGPHVEAEAKATRYDAERHATDVTKLWLALTLKY